MNIDDLQIVVLEDLKDHWDDPDVRALYADLMKMKFDGYGSVYGSNVISSDKADFFGTHLMVCQKGLRLKPLFGYKSVTLDKCREFHLKFPALSLVGNDGHHECLNELNEIIDRAENRGERVSFDYSWAQTPDIKKIRSKEMAELFRDLVMTLVIHHHQDYGIEHMITCGVVKVKTDIFFERLGLNKISAYSKFSQKDLNEEMVHIFHNNRYSDYAYEVAEKYHFLWKNRLTLSKKQTLTAVREAA